MPQHDLDIARRVIRFGARLSSAPFAARLPHTTESPAPQWSASRCRLQPELWQGAARQVDVERHHLSAARILVRTGEGNVGELQVAVGRTEGNGARQSGRGSSIIRIGLGSPEIALLPVQF